MRRRPRHRGAPASGLVLLALASCAPAGAQEPPEVPPALRQGLRTIQDYADAVQAQRRGPAGAERDPFQVTPELRQRRPGRPGPAAALPATAALASGWRVLALVLGERPRALLGPEAEAPAARWRERLVAEGDELEMPEGGLARVLRIDAQGVQLQIGGGLDGTPARVWIR
ncbi:hypothetical protein EV684_109150 [Rubrivivax gelatinosus]|uniref:Type IV pilus biogenesis protein PilP n=3 Tax=Rubrivivax gelatinosus TaxID=28068 RepID=A0A4R2M621_RUBGE|nr:hypothetical protein [Rubrivivax gelatinosus]TCP01511.1 hypothetical protein EV684_109150 [Rubrivivax gelatinosus]